MSGQKTQGKWNNSLQNSKPTSLRTSEESVIGLLTAQLRSSVPTREELNDNVKPVKRFIQAQKISTETTQLPLLIQKLVSLIGMIT